MRRIFILFLSLHLTGYLQSQSVISRHNIHVGEKKLERNQAKPEDLEEERNRREKDREARLLQYVLENGDSEPREFREDPGKPLYTNGIWRFIIQSQDLETGLFRTEYKINGSDLQVYRSPIAISSPGWNTIEYRSVDKAGNKEDWRITRIFRDVIPPGIQWNWDGSYYQRGDKYFITPETKILVTATDRESGLKGIYFQENQSSWKQWDSQGYKVPGSNNKDDISILLNIRALDRVNNRSNGITLSLQIVSKVKSPILHARKYWEKEGIRYCSNKTIIGFTKSESELAETIYYKSDPSEDWREYTSGEIHPRSDSTEEWKIQFKTINALGQESSIEEWSCRQDNQSPKTEIIRKDNN